MRRVPALARLIAFALVAAIALGAVPQSAAQEATPPAREDGADVDVRTRPLASAAIEILEPGTSNIVLGRLVRAPGASLPFDPNDPSASLLYVQSGELTVLADAAVAVSRGGQRGTPGAGETEPEAAGTEFTLGEDDAVLLPPNITGEVRNDGTEEVTVLVVSLAHATAASGTPTP
jgi:quercetin dioxygenase-like cupin family protein